MTPKETAREFSDACEEQQLYGGCSTCDFVVLCPDEFAPRFLFSGEDA